MKLGEAQAPDGMRLYAIGDVHGCDDLLADIHEKIWEDAKTHSSGDIQIIHLGDIVDRGPDTASVVERVSKLCGDDQRVHCLKGNHEEMLLRFLDAPRLWAPDFLVDGGDATLTSYGVSLDDWRSLTGDYDEFAFELIEKMPSHHRVFLKGLPYSVRFGDYFFCHAGIRPGVPLDQQDPIDLMSIRNGFLESDTDFGAVVVHGHTITETPEVRPNRINIDTGASRHGRLTCLVLEGSEYRFLSANRD